MVVCDAMTVAMNEKFDACCIPAMAVFSGSGIAVTAPLARWAVGEVS